MFKKVLAICVVMVLIFSVLIFSVGCGSVWEIDFEVERIGLVVPHYTSTHIRSVSGVRVMAEEVLRISSHAGWVSMLYFLSDNIWFGFPEESNDEHKNAVYERYSPQFFQNNAIILLTLWTATSGGEGWSIDAVRSNGEIDATEGRGTSLLAGESWTFAISVDRSFNPSRIRLNLTSHIWE